MIDILRQCRKEIAEFPEEVREDLADAMARFEEGHMLSMPLCRPMPSIGRGGNELRFRHRSGIYRVLYVLEGGGKIRLIHGFKKKTNATPQRNIELAMKRLKEIP